MIALKHRRASGTLENLWEVDPQRRLVMCVIGGAGFDVPVAYALRPRVGAYCLTRVSEDVWRISPAVFYLQKKAFITRAYHYPDTHVAEFIALTHAPPKIQRELADL